MYIFSFILLSFFAFGDIFLKRKKYHSGFIIIIILWLIFHDGFRWGIGTDWSNYFTYFSNCLEVSADDFEVGYKLLNRTIRKITENYTVFLVAHAILVYLLISRSIVKYSVNPLFSFLFFYCIMLTYLGMNRQYLAFSICVFSYKFILERKFISFALCIVTAFFFHTSALMFVFGYFLHIKIKTRYLIIILLTVVVVSVLGLMNRLPLNLFFLLDSGIADKLTFYAESDFLTTNPIFTILALVKRSIWIILALLFDKSIKNKNENYYFFFNLYFIGTIIYILFNNTILQIVVSRGVLYFNIAEIFLIPYILSIFKDGITKGIVFFLLLFYGLLTMQKGMNFYKDDLGVDIYRPYNSVLIDDTYDAMKK